MKHESIIPVGNNAAGVSELKEQTKDEPKPAVNVDARIEEIHQRANNIGPVLEEILRVGHQPVKKD